MTVAVAGILTQYGREPAMAFTVVVLAGAEGRIVLYHLSGPFSFGAAEGMARRLAAADVYDMLIFDFAEVTFLDSSASLAVEVAVTQAQSRGKEVFIVGLRREVAKTLIRLGVRKLLPRDHSHATRLEALREAAELIDSKEA